MKKLTIILSVVMSVLVMSCAAPMEKAHKHGDHDMDAMKMKGKTAHVCDENCTMDHSKDGVTMEGKTCESCGENCTCDHDKATSSEDMGAMTTTVKDGEFTTCAVSGEMVEVGPETMSAEHNGETYYFCCANCQAKFTENPEAYIGS